MYSIIYDLFKNQTWKKTFEGFTPLSHFSVTGTGTWGSHLLKEKNGTCFHSTCYWLLYVYHSTCMPREPSEVRPAVTEDRDLPCWYWEVNLCPLQVLTRWAFSLCVCDMESCLCCPWTWVWSWNIGLCYLSGWTESCMWSTQSEATVHDSCWSCVWVYNKAVYHAGECFRTDSYLHGQDMRGMELPHRPIWGCSSSNSITTY